MSAFLTVAIIHLLGRLKASEGYEPSRVLLLQPTSPLRAPEDIKDSIELFEKSGADSLVSVTRTENVLMTMDAGNVLRFENPEMLSSPNRQELPQYYKFDGSMIYLVKTDVLLRERSFFAGKVVGYEIERWRAVDLDEPQDFVVGEILFKHQDEIRDAIKKFV